MRPRTFPRWKRSSGVTIPPGTRIIEEAGELRIRTSNVLREILLEISRPRAMSPDKRGNRWKIMLFSAFSLLKDKWRWCVLIVNWRLACLPLVATRSASRFVYIRIFMHAASRGVREPSSLAYNAPLCCLFLVFYLPLRLQSKRGKETRNKEHIVDASWTQIYDGSAPPSRIPTRILENSCQFVCVCWFLDYTICPLLIFLRVLYFSRFSSSQSLDVRRDATLPAKRANGTTVEISRNCAIVLKLEPPEKHVLAVPGASRRPSTALNTALPANDSRANDESAHAHMRAAWLFRLATLGLDERAIAVFRLASCEW